MTEPILHIQLTRLQVEILVESLRFTRNSQLPLFLKNNEALMANESFTSLFKLLVDAMGGIESATNQYSDNYFDPSA